MDCKVQVKAQEKYSKGADCKEKVKEEGRIGKADFCEVCVKRQEKRRQAASIERKRRHRVESCGKSANPRAKASKRQPQAKIKCAEAEEW